MVPAKSCIALSMSLVVSGCSVVMMRDAPKQPIAYATEPECTDSRVPMAFDGVMGAGLLVYGLSMSGGDADQQAHVGDAAVLFSSIGVLFAASAVLGFIRARDCGETKEMWMAQMAAPRSPPLALAASPLVEVIDAKSPEAARLTRQAHAAAEADDCGPTMANAARVRSLDPEYFEKVFVADAAIARCR